MDNTIEFKPKYTAHRRAIAAVDTLVLATLLTANERNCFQAHGFNTIDGFVLMTAGTAPTTVLELLEAVTYTNSVGAETKMFVRRGGTVGPLNSGDGFSFNVKGGGRYFIRVSSLTGAPTGLEIYIAGSERAQEGSI